MRQGQGALISQGGEIVQPKLDSGASRGGSRACVSRNNAPATRAGPMRQGVKHASQQKVASP
eukprot:3088054-Pyramimonas_sp.AAC.1